MQRWINKWLWRGYRVLTLVAMMMDYMLPNKLMSWQESFEVYFEEAARIVDLVEPDSDLITLVDVTPVNRTRNFHNFSLETPEFFDDLYLRLTTEGVVETRPIYQLRTPDGAIYWVLTRGR